MALGAGPSTAATGATSATLAGQAAVAPATATAAPQSADPWPRDVTLANADALIYQPEIESWTGNRLQWRVAVALRPAGEKNETFGVLWGSARTEVDRSTRTVALEEVSVSQIKFPTVPDNGAAYLAGLRQALHGALATMALDSVEASLAVSQTVKPATRSAAGTRTRDKADRPARLRLERPGHGRGRQLDRPQRLGERRSAGGEPRCDHHHLQRQHGADQDLE